MSKPLTFGPVMIDLQGPELQAIEREKIAHPNTGAVILFTRNFENSLQISELTQQIRQARNGPVLITVDQEGGRVQRFREDYTRLPAASAYAQSPQTARAGGWLMAAELLASGIDFSFAPVLDVDCGISEVIGDRSFSQNPQEVVELANAFRQGMRAAGMSAVGKHFPGHGAVAVDSHLGLPVDERDLDSIRNKDLLPFKALIDDGLEGIMPAHVVYQQIDSLPAGFSEIWIQHILRQQLGFSGTVFSDDLSMQGAAVVGDFTERAGLALQAGCDMVLVCNAPQAAEQVLDSLAQQSSQKRQMRLQKMQGQATLNLAQLQQTDQWQQISQQIMQSSFYA